MNFLPICLFMQFNRYANIYFLISAIITSIPSISPISPVTSWLPLIFVKNAIILKIYIYRNF